MMAILRTLVLRSGLDVPVARLATDTSVGAAAGGAGSAAAQTIDMRAKVRLESVERRLQATAAVPRKLQSRGGGGAQRSVSALR
jgi:hypothetical protein